MEGFILNEITRTVQELFQNKFLFLFCPLKYFSFPISEQIVRKIL
jgi:hypothetical protein